MKEKLLKYKWIIITLGMIAFHLGWQCYSQFELLDGIKIEEYVEEEQVATKISEQTAEQEKIDDIKEEKIWVDSNLEVEETVPVIEEIQEKVPVYICGAIQNPGVYYVSPDAIINDVVQIGGGFTKEADVTAINLARAIMPNEKIIVFKQGEEIDKFEDSYENRERIATLPGSQLDSQSSKDTSLVEHNGLININTATKEQLMALSGIGEIKAEAIITYRQENNGFESIDEIMQISGIGEKTFEKLEQFITTQ